MLFPGKTIKAEIKSKVAPARTVAYLAALSLKRVNISS